MTAKGEKIHAFWVAATAMLVVLGKKSRREAEKEAYQMIVEKYGEDTLMREFEIDKPVDL